MARDAAASPVEGPIAAAAPLAAPAAAPHPELGSVAPSERAAARRRRRSSHVPYGAIFVLVLCVVATAWIALRSVVDVGPARIPLSTLSTIVPALVAGWFALGVLRRRDLNRRDRTGWVFVALACGAAGVFASTVLVPGGAASEGLTPMIGAIAHLLTLLLGAVGVLHWSRRISPAASIGTALDLMCVALLAYVVSWRTILHPALLGATDGQGMIDQVSIVAAPALGTFLMVAVVTVFSQVGKQELRGSELLATFGFAGIVATDLAMALHGVNSGAGFDDAWQAVAVGSAGGSLIDLGWTLGVLAVAFGGATRRMAVQADATAAVPLMERSATWELLISLVPFAFLGAVIFTQMDRTSSTSARAIAGGVVVVLAAVLLVRCALVAVSAIRAARTSTTDQLTGALNHRQFQERLPLLVERAAVSGRALSLMVIDIDDFGLLNDSFSHAEGDLYLRDVAWLIRRHVGDGHLVFRNGGDEFAVLMPDTEEHLARAIAERLSRAVHELRTSSTVQPTITVGIASVPEDTTDAHELFQLANGTLYWGKLNGKNVVTCYDRNVVKVLNAEDRMHVMEQSARLRAVLALARALDARDAYTARHSENVARYSVAIAAELGWDPERIELLRVAGLLHDVGKIGVRDSTLRKASRLTREEWAEMQQHPVLGARMIAGVAPEEVIPWVVAHHERIDGKGYPNRQAGDDIPEGARVLSVADTFDAMTSSRSYRPALSPLRAIAEIANGAGVQFDPFVVRAFLSALKKGTIDAVAIELAAATQQAQEVWDGPELEELPVHDPEFLSTDHVEGEHDAQVIVELDLAAPPSAVDDGDDDAEPLAA